MCPRTEKLRLFLLGLGVGLLLSFLVGTGIKLVAAVGMLTFVVADTWPALRAWFATVF